MALTLKLDPESAKLKQYAKYSSSIIIILIDCSPFSTKTISNVHDSNNYMIFVQTITYNTRG